MVGTNPNQMAFSKQPRFATVVAPGVPTIGSNFGAVPLRNGAVQMSMGSSNRFLAARPPAPKPLSMMLSSHQ